MVMLSMLKHRPCKLCSDMVHAVYAQTQAMHFMFESGQVDYGQTQAMLFMFEFGLAVCAQTRALLFVLKHRTCSLSSNMGHAVYAQTQAMLFMLKHRPHFLCSSTGHAAYARSMYLFTSMYIYLYRSGSRIRGSACSRYDRSIT